MAKSQHHRLIAAKKNPKDEFYTQFIDIQEEVKKYKEQFENKIMYCNCDDPETSEFFRYFAINFEGFKLKKLITTHFVYSDMFVKGKTYKLETTQRLDLTPKGKIEIDSKPHLKKTILKENGDFRSDECIEFMKEADIVCTNPPLSLFKEYIEQLIKYNKKFLVIGHQNAITYKEIFPLLKENKM
jgi:hypothetical protein